MTWPSRLIVYRPLTLPRLNLGQLAGQANLAPKYDRAAVCAGIVHLGVGNFHRAHQAVYIDKVLAQDPRWGIIGASLRRPDVHDALAPQDFLYTVLELDGSDRRCKVISSLLDCIYVAADTEALLVRLANPQIAIVSLTITEKGYCHDPTTGDLDLQRVAADLVRPECPATAIGLLTEGLRRRRSQRRAPFTVLSCDNLASNGKLLARLVDQYARQLDVELADWIAAEVHFPATMVDRIVPATSAADRTTVRQCLGLEDHWPVPAEPFSQWVIEDFPGARPAWEEAGVQMVADVAAHEQAKLSILNGSHFALAFIGLRLGHELVSDCTTDADLMAFIRHILKYEVLPTLAVPAGVSLADYVEATLARYANVGVVHRLVQISMDGSQKIGPRILDPVRANLQAGRPAAGLEAIIAAWLGHWIQGWQTDTDLAADPRAAYLKQVWQAQQQRPAAFALAVTQDPSVFGDLAGAPGFAQRIQIALNHYLANPRVLLAAIVSAT